MICSYKWIIFTILILGLSFIIPGNRTVAYAQGSSEVQANPLDGQWTGSCPRELDELMHWVLTFQSGDINGSVTKSKVNQNPADQVESQTYVVKGKYRYRANNQAVSLVFDIYLNATDRDPLETWRMNGSLEPSGIITVSGRVDNKAINLDLSRVVINPPTPTPTATPLPPANTPTPTPTVTATPAVGGGHASLTTYEGSATCFTCHADQVLEIHGSDHYQWHGLTPNVINKTEGGKLGTINDFCTFPNINFSFKMTNVDNKEIVTGCAKCHVGFGELPSSETIFAQLYNIDCLLCHSDDYRRKGVEVEPNVFRFVPDEASMPVSMAEALHNIKERPSKIACLRCHANAGGGDGVKQGDIQMAQADPPRSLDVHMASVANGGAGLVCVDCHLTQNHKIAGRGNDLQVTDLDYRVQCTNCHSSKPHGNSNLDKHTGRLDCAVCHIPAYGRGTTPTEIYRDFRESELDVAKRFYEPVTVKASDVIPTYKFFNGNSYFYEFGKPIDSPDGHLLAGPAGSIQDANAKIFPFKHHESIMPYGLANQQLLFVKSKTLWETGDMNQAIVDAANDVGWTEINNSSDYGFVHTDRYFQLSHQVAPAESALSCNDCHNGGTRLDFDALGYQRRTTLNGRPLCASCHSDKSDEWSASELFSRVHQKHVTEKHFDCINCHYFNAAT